MSRAVVLSAGRDPTLMFTRRELLKSAGYSVVEAATSRDLEELLPGDFDVAILCHTISAEEKRKMATVIRERSPSTAILALVNHSGEMVWFADASILNDPAALLAEVPQLIGQVRHRQSDLSS